MTNLASLVATKTNTVLLAAIVTLLAGGTAAYVHHVQVEEGAREVALQQELARRQAARALADKQAAAARLGEKKAADFFTISPGSQFNAKNMEPATPTPQPTHP